MRLFTSAAFAFLIVLGGCSTEPEPEPRKTAEESQAPTENTEGAETVSTPRTRISSPREEDPASPGPMATPADAGTTATVAEASTTAAATMAATPPAATPEIVAIPSNYPVEMARTVELRKQLEQVQPESGALTDEQATTLERFAVHMMRVAETDTQLPRDQRKAMEDYAGKLQYQAEHMRQGQADTTFQNRLAGVKRIMESLQNSIAIQQAQPPQQQ